MDPPTPCEPDQRCSTCGEPYTVPPTPRATVCSDAFHCCRDCTWHKGKRTVRCARNATPKVERDEIAASQTVGMTPEDVIEHLRDPAFRAAFNAYPGLPPRIALRTVDEPQDDRRRAALLAFRQAHDITRNALACALQVRPDDVRALEEGEKATNDEGWLEITTMLFLLGSGLHAEEVANPIGSGALDRVLAAPDDDESVVGDLPPETR